MALVLLGVYLILWTAGHWSQPPEQIPDFPLWVRLLGPTLPLLTLPKWHGHIRIGVVALAVVGVLTLNARSFGFGPVVKMGTLFCGAVMIWSGWTGRSAAERVKELKEIGPWIAIFLLLYVGLRVGGLVLNR